MSPLPNLLQAGLLSTLLAAGAALIPATVVGLPTAAVAASSTVLAKTVKVNGLDVFYREAGPKDAPVVLLLHGFPSSSHMFRDLIPALAGKYRVLAPDYPGFGSSSAPDLAAFPYTFEAITDVIDGFTAAVGAKNYVLFMQDYGGPVGFRLAVRHPERVRGLIIQNAVANVEGWNPDVVKQIAPFWMNRNAETEKPVRGLLTADTTKFQYTQGATRTERLNPDAWIYDQARLDRPGNDAIQAQILWNYQDNVAQYPRWQEYMKKHQPATLIVWGKNDPFFTTKGVDYFKAELPKAEVHLYDAGHFALETHVEEIGGATLDFLKRLPKGH